VSDFDRGRLVAYRGKEGCRSVICTRLGDQDRCYGWHCVTCHAPTSSQGHRCPDLTVISKDQPTDADRAWLDEVAEREGFGRGEDA
jgi:hypothetical protein